jgi:dipeptidyl aminopeptidase/acylaminoacyl peptidase
MRSTHLPFAFWLVVTFIAGPAFAPAQEPRTVAEKTDYRATSRHADVLAFCEELAQKSPVVRLGELGTSGEGRKLPLVILADPPVRTPEEARRSGKFLVYAQANIHAGEVDGKEALLMLARDIALDPKKPLLKELVIVLCPDVNPDGNERIDTAHRRSQNGPADGVGVRENAAGLDLNRDFIKLESPEDRALVKFLNRWDPAIVIDCHTTDGSKHRYTLTYDGPRNPNANQAMIDYVSHKLLPEVGRRMEEQTGYKSFWYGNFSRGYTRWETYPAVPRYGIQYFAIRGHIPLLSESYTYASFKDRVLSSHSFVRNILDYAATHKDEVSKLVKEKSSGDALALRTDTVPQPAPVTVPGFETELRNGRPVPTDKPKDYELKLVTRVEPTVRATKPYAYLVPASYTAAIETLQRHGLTLQELREDIELDVEVYRVEQVSHDPREYQKHHEVTLHVAPARPDARRVPAGTVIVRTAQPLGTLAGVLLEPQSEDGLATWNFFDAGLADGKDFPVLRLPKAVPLTAGPVRPLAEGRQMNKPITKAALLGEGRGLSFAGNPVGERRPGDPNSSPLTWLEDGEHFLQMKEGRLYKVHARSGRAELFVDPAKLERSLAALPGNGRRGGQDQGRGRGQAQGRGGRWQGRGGIDRMDPQRTGNLVDYENDLYFAHFDGTPALRLTRSPGRKELATFSPDGKFVAFVRGGNLYVVDLATRSERALTTDGGGDVLNGRADWVYEEEVFNRRGRPLWWSPDSKYIAFLRFDDAPVKRFTIVDHLPTRLGVEEERYPKAGDPNPLVTLHVVSAAGGDVKAVDLSTYSPTASIIDRVAWAPDGQRLFVYVQDRAQTWLDVCTAPSGGGPATRLFRETTRAWVDDPGDPHFLADGSFLLASERSGWKHLYHFDAAGKLLNPVGSGPWEVRGTGGGPFQGKPLHHVDEKGGWVYVTGTRDSPTATNLYRVKLDGSGAAERLTNEPGDHTVSVNPTGTLFIDSSSDTATPTKVVLRSTDGGSVVRVLDTNPVYQREEYRFGAFERVQIPLKDGCVLEGTIIKPPDFSAGKRYPVWFQTYGGPHAPTVHDAWQGGRVQEQVLAGMGFVVFRCDPRSASGKGAVSTWACYRKLGVQELKDIEEAIDWLCKNPWVDPKRIGMSGHSYGGFMTAFALTHSKKFAAGIAGAPVTDWRNYDSIYTERYMNTPQENPDGYKATSVVRAAEDLHGRLLLLHGLIDDNVHPQNTFQLVDALERADKDFELMVFPRSRHGISGAFYQRLMLDFIERLRDEPVCDGSEKRPDASPNRR